MTQLVLIAAAMAALPAGANREPADVRLFVRPMPAPRPAMRYQLLPDLAELNPGNAAQGYLKSFAEQRSFFHGKGSVADRARYRKLSMLELRLERLENYGGSALRHADWAARLETVDWQALPRVRDGGL